jgi:hypothetical protein
MTTSPPIPRDFDSEAALAFAGDIDPADLVSIDGGLVLPSEPPTLPRLEDFGDRGRRA